MHIQKFGGQTKQLPCFFSLQLLPLLLSCQISIGSKFCINDDDDWEILIYKPCPPRQQIIFKAAQEHNNGFILGFSTAILLQFSVLKVTFFSLFSVRWRFIEYAKSIQMFLIFALNSTTVDSNEIFCAKFTFYRGLRSFSVLLIIKGERKFQ